MIYSAVVELLEKEEFRNGVNYPQFLSIFTSGLIGNQTREQIMSMFRIIDEDESGTIKVEDLRRLVKDIGESVTVDELRDIIGNVTGGDVEIPFEQFYNIFKKSAAPYPAH